MLKPEIDSPEKVAEWIRHPVPAIFQGQDLRKNSASIAGATLTGCAFLGCAMEATLREAAAAAECLVIPTMPGLPFDPFEASLYTPADLYDTFDPDAPDPDATYRQCRDWQIYISVVDPGTREDREVDVDVALMRRIHDHSIDDALGDLIAVKTPNKCVALMGGHNRGRDEAVFEQTARLALALVREGYFIVSGGGPGLMEAANLGAYAAGFANPENAISIAIAELKKAPLYKSKGWLTQAFRAQRLMGEPATPASSESLGLPTWFYGHEPPNVFATHIAKYFENSVREEGLLSLARGGVIYAEGNAGTVQEIFQDANQNYYRTYGKVKSPMVLFNKEYWNLAYLLLHKLATEKQFDDYVFLSDSPDAIVQFIKDHPPTG